MIFIFLLLIVNVSIINCIGDNNETDIKIAWSHYKLKHNRFYKTNDDESLRFSIWEKNLKFINEHNKKFDQGLVTYKLSMNEFGDLTNREFEKQTSGIDRGLKRMRNKLQAFVADESVTIPEELSWVKLGHVTPVKNQGSCGSCWAFAAVGAIEALFYNKTGVMVELSEQLILDCSDSYGNEGCLGGLMENAFQYVVDHGIIESENYTYVNEQRSCKAPVNATRRISGFKVTKSGDEEDLVKACALNGPVTVSIDASKETFRFYSEGIYHEPSCSSVELDHGVLMVGYGIDNQTGIKYYEIKNSWGKSWGENGFGKMIRDKNNNCGIATDSSYPYL